MLDWMILTKRPENFIHMLPIDARHPNLWLGVTVENREQAERRIPILSRTPAPMRFISCEPLLEDISPLDLKGIDLVIVGGESGATHERRVMEYDWAQRIREQCKKDNVSFYMKQGTGMPYKLLPKSLQVREFPWEEQKL
jgi:protein gp37